MSEDFASALEAAFPVLFRRLNARFRDPQLAEEVSRDCLSEAWETFRDDPGFLGNQSLTSWTSCRAGWRALDRLRERGRLSPLADAEDEGRTCRDEIARDDRDRDRRAVWDGLGGLDETDRKILVEYYYDGRTDQEIGADLFGDEGTPESRGLRVWRRRQKALGRLAEPLRRAGIDGQDYGAEMMAV